MILDSWEYMYMYNVHTYVHDGLARSVWFLFKQSLSSGDYGLRVQFDWEKLWPFYQV